MNLTSIPPSVTPAARGPWWTPRRLAWLGGVFIAAMTAQAAWDIWRSHDDTLRNTERDLGTQARLIAEQTARGVQAVDVVLKHLAEQLQRETLTLTDAEGLHRQLRDEAQGLVQADGLVAFGADGKLRAASQIAPHHMLSLVVAAEDPFVKLREQATADLMISNVRVSPGTQRHVFPIGRRVQDRSGRFIGVVGAPGRVEYFENFYRDSYPDPSTRIALVHRESWLLARHPTATAMLGQRLSVVDRLLPTNSEVGAAFARLPSPVDGVDHFVALRQVPGYPLIVAVSRDAEVAFAPWRSQALATALRTALLGALAALLLWLGLRQLHRAHAAQRALELSEQRYALAMTGSDEGHWLWDIAAGQVYVSERLAKLFGLPPGAQTMADSAYFAAIPLHPEDGERVHHNRNEHVAGHTPRLDHEFRIIDPTSGQVRWIHTRAQCFRDAAGAPLRLAGSTVDITPRKQAEAERQRLEEQLRQAQKLEAIGTLAGGIAHDFNNILSAILGYGEMAQQSAPEGSAQRRHIEAAIAAAQRAKSLVERILAFSRGGTGARVPVHVQSVVAEALDGVATTLGVELHLQRQLSAGDAGVLGDATQIHQVVLNLCANAVQAMHGRGLLDVSLGVVRLEAPLAVATCTLPAGEYLRLDVADSGSGIAPALLERIFDPFFTTKEVGVGTGLGLSLVHGIVSELGGGIAVASQVGHGSRFSVYLPQHAVVAAPRTAATLAIEHGEGQVVLLVDDEEALVRLGEETLAELGYEPVGYVSSTEALAALRTDAKRFDLLLSDEAMPGLTGCELVGQARALRPELPVVLMSGFVTPALTQRARQLGVHEVLNKPLSRSELARAVAAALRARRGSPML